MLFKTVIISFLFFAQHQKIIPDFVKEYHALSSKKEEMKYIEKYKEEKSPSVKAYVISLQIKQAKYKLFPWRKLAIFNREKKKLNVLINNYSNNIHLRYIRLVIQERTPLFLNFNKHLKEDKNFLKLMLEKEDKTDYLDVFILKNTSL